MKDPVADYGWPPRLIMRLACQYTGRSRWYLARAARDGALAVAGRNGRSLVFDRAALDALLVGERDVGSKPKNVAPVCRASAPTSNALDRLAAIRKGTR